MNFVRSDGAKSGVSETTWRSIASVTAGRADSAIVALREQFHVYLRSNKHHQLSFFF